VTHGLGGFKGGLLVRRPPARSPAQAPANGRLPTSLQTPSDGRRAFQLRAYFALGFGHRALILAYLNRPEEAIISAEQAIRLSPFDPAMFAFCETLALAHLTLGRYEEGLRWAEAALRENSGLPPAGGRSTSPALASCCANSSGWLSISLGNGHRVLQRSARAIAAGRYATGCRGRRQLRYFRFGLARRLVAVATFPKPDPPFPNSGSRSPTDAKWCAPPSVQQMGRIAHLVAGMRSAARCRQPRRLSSSRPKHRPNASA
jgi:tetratricopeptide (TPR) repeat protein